MLKTAVVTFVKNDFGFCKTEDGLSVFFHQSDERKVKFHDDGKPFLSFERKRSEKSAVVQGVKILVNVTSNEKGYRAEAWGVKSEKETAPSKIESASDTLYRLLKHTRFVGNKECEPEILWEGTDIAELIQEHPRKVRIENFSCDDFSTWTTMEKMTDGHWERTDDIRK